VTQQALAVKHAVGSLLSIMDDCAGLMETLLQWMSHSPTARQIDAELGDLRGDLLAPAPLFGYLRYNISLTGDSLQRLGMQLAGEKIAALSAMDDPANMATLQEVGVRAAKQQIRGADFAACFDLR
jgi:uncharacterized protein